MTSDKFIRKVAADSGMTLKDVRAINDAFESALASFLTTGEEVKVCDVNFAVVDVPPTDRFNPITKETAHYPATKKVTARPSSTLKRLVKGN